ncbi:MAG: hypothetical protein JKY67_01090 [Pseudomonadales bacterium]|nr:hypothetical protein [Pseudomonadales bacterium]
MYVQSIFFPVTSQYGVVHDNIVVSRSLLRPFTTLISVAAWVGVVTTAIVKRHYVMFGFAVFFFLAGHLLESTVIPLELYFEHRNYLASFGLIYAVSWSLLIASKSLSQPLNVLKKVILFCLVAVFSLVSIDVTGLWGKPTEQALAWAMQNPDSLRANQYLYAIVSKDKQPVLANKLIDNMIVKWPEVGLNYIKKMRILCDESNSSVGKDRLVELGLTEKLALAKITHWELRELKEIIIKGQGQSGCEGLTREAVLALFDSLYEAVNRGDTEAYRTTVIKNELDEIMGRYFFAEALYREALDPWGRLYFEKPSALIAYFMAYSYYKLGEDDIALRTLSVAKEQLKKEESGYDRKMQTLKELETLLREQGR